MDPEQFFPIEHSIRADICNIWWHCLCETAEMERLVLDLGQGWFILLLGKKKKKEQEAPLCMDLNFGDGKRQLLPLVLKPVLQAWVKGWKKLRLCK